MPLTSSIYHREKKNTHSEIGRNLHQLSELWGTMGGLAPWPLEAPAPLMAWRASSLDPFRRSPAPAVARRGVDRNIPSGGNKQNRHDQNENPRNILCLEIVWCIWKLLEIVWVNVVSFYVFGTLLAYPIVLCAGPDSHYTQRMCRSHCQFFWTESTGKRAKIFGQSQPDWNSKEWSGICYLVVNFTN